MNNNRIVLPYTVQLAISEANKYLKIPLKGKGTLETIMFFGDSVNQINGVTVYQKPDTKGIRILGEVKSSDTITATVTNRLTFGTEPIILVLNMKFNDTFLELWFNNSVATAYDIAVILRISKTEPEVRRQS